MIRKLSPMTLTWLAAWTFALSFSDLARAQTIVPGPPPGFCIDTIATVPSGGQFTVYLTNWVDYDKLINGESSSQQPVNLASVNWSLSPKLGQITKTGIDVVNNTAYAVVTAPNVPSNKALTVTCGASDADSPPKTGSVSAAVIVTGTACIELEINQPGPQDNYLALGGTGALTVSVSGGDSGTNYTVALSCAGAGSPAGSVAFSSSSVTVAGGGTQTVTLSGQAIGSAAITGTASNAATGTVNATVVQLASVTVASGATQKNVSPEGGKNWAAVKSATGNVTVQAKLNPDVTPAGPPDLVTWTGGNAVSGQPLQRTVPLAISASTEVTAACGGISDKVDVWVLWATIDNMTLGQSPSNAYQVPPTTLDGTQNLGAVLYSGSNCAAGKVVPVAKLTPLGVNAVVRNGWNINRRKRRADFKDGLPDTARWDNSWQPDPEGTPVMVLVPDSADKIYDFDAPVLFVDNSMTDSYERNDNFQEWVTWNGSSGGNGSVGMCSDYAPWYWQARAKRSATPEITFASVSAGSLSLPGSNGSYYKRISGAVTIAGNNEAGNNGLEGATVSAPCTSDAANTIGTSGTVSAQTDKYTGEFTILTVPPGSCTLTPTLTGYTFNPKTSTLTVSTTGQVTGANFTATKSP